MKQSEIENWIEYAIRLEKFRRLKKKALQSAGVEVIAKTKIFGFEIDITDHGLDNLSRACLGK